MLGLVCSILVLGLACGSFAEQAGKSEKRAGFEEATERARIDVEVYCKLARLVENYDLTEVLNDGKGLGELEHYDKTELIIEDEKTQAEFDRFNQLREDDCLNREQKINAALEVANQRSTLKKFYKTMRRAEREIQEETKKSLAVMEKIRDDVKDAKLKKYFDMRIQLIKLFLEETFDEVDASAKGIQRKV